MELTFKDILTLFYYKYWHGKISQEDLATLRVFFGIAVKPHPSSLFRAAQAYEIVQRGNALSEVVSEEDFKRLRVYLIGYRPIEGFAVLTPVNIQGKNQRRLALRGFDLGVQEVSSQDLAFFNLGRYLTEKLSSYFITSREACIFPEDLDFSAHEVLKMELQLKQIHKLFPK